MTENHPRNSKWIEKISHYIISHIELFFNRLGQTIAKHPRRTILICIGVMLLSTLGFLRFRQEKNPMKLWVPAGSDFLRDTEWLVNTFQRYPRPEAVIAKAEDVLTPKVLLELNYLNDKVLTSDLIKWGDICFKIPMVSAQMSALMRSKSNNSESDDSGFDPSYYLPTFMYCSIVNSFSKGCFQQNILEIWNYDSKTISQLTKQEILDKISETKISPVSGHPVNYEKLLGGIRRNSTGHIVSAETVLSIWMADVNFTQVDMDKAGNDIGTADWATVSILKWEENFIKIMQNASKNMEHSKIFYVAGRSFSDISGYTIFGDIPTLMIGVFLMVAYIQIAISKMNCVDAKIVLGFCGLFGIGLSIVVACGICSLLGVFYGPVHTSLPFLMMGLGVDDMFVLAASWNIVSERKLKAPIHEKIGLMLQHAGVSISVTSLTDFMAFLVGSCTIIPSLKSFCIYAGFGVLMTFIYVVTFFVACFTLDQQRADEYRNGIIPCIKYQPYQKNECSQRQFAKSIFHFVYDKFLFTVPGKILIIGLTIALTGVGIQGAINLKQKFDPMWFIPKNTYLSNFVEERIHYYPEMGFEASLLMGKINFTEEYPKIKQIVLELENQTDILTVTSSWVRPFQRYLLKNYNKDIDKETLSEKDWNHYLSLFLFSPKGGKFQANFKFAKELKCGYPASEILLSLINYRFHSFTGPEQYLPAMRKVREIAANANFTTGDRFATAWGKIFASWMTDEVIDKELMRNMSLALVCVMFCTAILIADLQICFWIFFCVVLTLVNVCGWMQKWGMTIDIVSCICLTLGIGLCVDYAAHIGYTFITVPGESKQDRALITVTSIGTAVLHGGLSTLLALSSLAYSDAYTFQAFFKVFLLVVLFGQFFGIVLLPVILSLIGPKSRRTHESVQQTELNEH